MLRRLTAYMQFQHATLALYRLLKIVRDRFLEHNVAVRGRIVCVFEVYLHVYRGRDGCVCVCVCACARPPHSHTRTCARVFVCNVDALWSLVASVLKTGSLFYPQ